MSDLSERLKSLLLHVEDIIVQARKEPFDPPYIFPPEDRRGLEELQSLGLTIMAPNAEDHPMFREVGLTHYDRELARLLRGDRSC